MRMAEQFDISTLAWVKGEIDETLKQARVALEAHVEEPGQKDTLRTCIDYIHQVYGTLLVVELSGAALFAEETERFAEALLNDQIAEQEPAYELLMRAILQLPEYLDRLLDGRADNPVALMPLLNEMRQQRDEPLFDSADFFRPNLQAAMPQGAGHRLRATPQQAAQTLRRFYLNYLAKLLKGDAQGSLPSLTIIVERLEASAVAENWRRLLWVAGAMIEGLRDQSIELTRDNKLLLGKFEQQLKSVAESGEPDELEPRLLELQQKMLYLIATSGASGAQATAVREAFRLGDYLPDEQGSMTGLNAELKKTVSADIMEELSRVKDAFDIFVRGDRTTLGSLEPMAESLVRMADTLGLLQEEELRKILHEQNTVIRQLLAGEMDATDDTLMGIAGAILAVESALGDWGSNTPMVVADASDEQLDDRETSPQAEAEHQRVTRQVMREAKEDLIRVREGISRYLERPGDSKILAPLPDLLYMIIGSLSLLSYKRVAQILTSCRGFIQQELIDSAAMPETQKLDALADAVMSVEYYLEAFIHSRVHPGSVLDVAEVAVAKLGYPVGTLQAPAVASLEPETSALEGIEVAEEDAEQAVAEFDFGQDAMGIELQDLEVEDEAFSGQDADSERDAFAGLSLDDDAAQVFEQEGMDGLALNDEAAGNVGDTVSELEMDFDLSDTDGLSSDIEREPVTAATPKLDWSRLKAAEESAPADEAQASLEQEGVTSEAEEVALDIDSAGDAFVADLAEQQDEAIAEQVPEADSEKKSEPAAPAASSQPLEIDEEILEIFIEEAEEELANIRELLPQWIADQSETEALKTLRRSFHTLKGSGRLVGASELGEFAWAFENMLNRVIEGTLQPGMAIFDMLEQATETLPVLIKQFRTGTSGNNADAEMLRQLATEVAQPGSAKPAAIAKPAAVPSQAEQNAATIGAIPELDSVLLDIYSKESESHLEQLDLFISEYQGGGSHRVTEPLIRALHTLKGSSRMAGVMPVADVCELLEKYAKTLQASHQAMSDKGIEALSACRSYILKTLVYMSDRAMPLPDPSKAMSLARLVFDEVSHLEELAIAQPEAGLASVAEALADTALDEHSGEPHVTETAQDEEVVLAPPPEVPAPHEVEMPASKDKSPDFFDEQPREDEHAPFDALPDEDEDETPLSDIGEDTVSFPGQGLTEEVTERTTVAPSSSWSFELMDEPDITPATDPEAKQDDAAPHPGFVPESMAFDDDYDEDLLDIFLDEGAEILDASEETLQAWVNSPDDRTLVEALQRQLHTLKGGARMAGIRQIGDLGHSLESTFEAVNDGLLKRSPEMLDLLQLSHDRLVTMLEQVRRRVPVISGDDLIQRVEALAAGEPLPTGTQDVDTGVNEQSELAVEVDESSARSPVEDALDLVDVPDYSSVPSRPQPAPIEQPVAEEPFAESQEAEQPEPLTSEESPRRNSPGLRLVSPVDEPQAAAPVEPTMQDGGIPPLSQAVDELEVQLSIWLRDIDDRALFAQMLGAAHSMLQLTIEQQQAEMSEIAAAACKLFEAIGDGHVAVSSKSSDLMAAALDQLRQNIGQIQRNEPPSNGHFITLEVDDLIKQGLAEEGAVEITLLAEEEAPSLPAEQPGPEAAVEVKVEADREQADSDADKRRGPRIQHEVVRVRSDLLDELVNYAGEVSIYRSRVEQQIGTFRGNIVEMDQTINRLRDQVRLFEIENEAQIESRREEAKEAGYEDFDPLEFDRFTHMQQLSRSMMESLSDLVSIEDMLTGLTRETETLLLQQSRVSTDLQESLIHTRMIPLVENAPRLRRVVRQTAAELGKRAALHFEGVEVEMDRSVAERLMAPLEHMLRNSIAHGIEERADRLKAGKAEEGNIRITLSREGSEVVVRVSDDGSGINLEAVRSKAIERGMMKPGVQLAEKELARFILQSGFSTAQSLSQIAGRGVGMDVVSSEIKQLGGVLDIDTVAGKGTTFTIRLPLTLSVSRALLVQVVEDTYAIPLMGIRSIERIGASELQELLKEENPVYTWLGDDYRLVHLTNALGMGQGVINTEAGKQALLLASSGDQRLALAVDNLLGSREVVVKSMGVLLSEVNDLAGATILADGSVALIIDMPSLIRRGMITAAEAQLEQGVPVVEEREPVVMVVDDSITVRKVTERLLSRHNMKCVTAKDGVDALARLEEVMPDVMLLDIEMPRMDGFELATHMRNSDHYRGVPIIMITSRTGDKHRQRAMDIGVNIYMGKPYTEVDLLENIEKLIG